ncbi:MAG: type II toxin-antitoxin system VapC family toxin [Burkholderiales bacterium]
MIVVDTNVLMALFIKSGVGSAADSLYRADRDWAAPRLWRSEMRNALTRYLRAGHIDPESARGIQSEAEGLIGRNAYEIDSEAVFDLVAVSSCSAYDCEFVALALQLGVPLVTCDRQILRDFPDVAIDLMAT